VQEQQEVIIAQAEPAPAPPAPEAQAQEQNQSQPQSQSSQPQELPKTGSSYPLVGLVGLFSLGLYSLLRAKRLA
jgi:LPXTG-motif cell wall-anchored protein